MTEMDQTLLVIRGTIASLPPELAEACNELAEHMQRMIEVAGEPVGPLALALVGAEAAAK